MLQIWKAVGYVVGQKMKKGKDTLLLMRMPRLLLLGMPLVLKKARLEMRRIEKLSDGE